MSNDNKRMFPVVVLSSEGRVLNVVETNEKGYKKSIENNELWYVVGGTGRLLPFDAGEDYRFEDIRKNEDWIEVIYSPIESSKNSEVSLEGAGSSIGISGGKVTTVGDKSSKATSGRNLPDIDVLEKLIGIIRQRRAGKEGSYTSYLFSEGSDKIRKKLGEEAVELILARKQNEMVYEAADLLYHLFVLLESENIEMNKIFLELKSRMEKE